MHEQFARLTAKWLERAHVYNGSIGGIFHDFRYRLEQNDTARCIRAAAYSKVCYELADDRAEREFPWDEAGVEALKAWLQERYEAFLNEENGDGA